MEDDVGETPRLIPEQIDRMVGMIWDMFGEFGKMLMLVHATTNNPSVESQEAFLRSVSRVRSRSGDIVHFYDEIKRNARIAAAQERRES